MRCNLIVLIFFFGIASCAQELKKPLTLVKLFDVKKAKPSEGDWLAEHREQWQTLADYIDAKPNKISADKSKLYTTVIGPMDSADYACYNLCKQYLELIYPVTIDTLQNIPLNNIGADHQRKNTFGLQLHSEYILDSILRTRLPADAYGLVAFTSIDLYPEPSWNFVFGQANLKARVGVWSMARHKEADSSGSILQALSDKRTLSVAVHEVGHMFGIKHCVPYECVMNGSNSLYESDQQVSYLCHECLSKLDWNKAIDFKNYFKKINTFWRQHKTIDSSAATYFGSMDSMMQAEQMK